MTQIYISNLGPLIWEINVGAQKIDGLTLVTYGIVIARFSIQDKLVKIRFFEEIFLLDDISIKPILEILFLSLGNIDIWFAEIGEFILRNYTITEALSTTQRVVIINKKKFAKLALDRNAEILVVHIAFLLALSIYFNQESQLGSLLAY